MPCLEAAHHQTLLLCIQLYPWLALLPPCREAPFALPCPPTGPSPQVPVGAGSPVCSLQATGSLPGNRQPAGTLTACNTTSAAPAPAEMTSKAQNISLHHSANISSWKGERKPEEQYRPKRRLHLNHLLEACSITLKYKSTRCWRKRCYFAINGWGEVAGDVGGGNAAKGKGNELWKMEWTTQTVWFPCSSQHYGPSYLKVTMLPFSSFRTE